MTHPDNKREHCLKDKSLFISCVVPIHNESPNILSFFNQLQHHLASVSNKFEIIAIDDGSSDDSLTHLKTLAETTHHLKILAFSRNFGKENALTAGIEHTSGDVVILIDADFQDSFDCIKQFLQRWSEGYDMVYGVRQDRHDETWLKKTFSKLFYFLLNKLNEIPIPKHARDFRLMDRKVVNALLNCNENNRFMKGLYAWVGFRTTSVAFSIEKRPHGKTSWGFHKLVGLGLNGIFAFSTIPLRIWGAIGFFMALISFIYGLWIILSALFFGVKTPGFSTIIVAIIFFGGMQLLSIGILGEYIGRIFTEVKQRPKYIVDEKIGFDDK